MEEVRGFTVLEGSGGQLPTRATRKSAGYDFYLTEDLWLSADPEAVAIVPTGVNVFMPDDEVFLLFIRSSLSAKGIFLANGVGVIDSDYYPNEIKLMVRNLSGEEIVINKGDRVMQGIFTSFYVGNDQPIAERKGGIGSTGA